MHAAFPSHSDYSTLTCAPNIMLFCTLHDCPRESWFRPDRVRQEMTLTLSVAQRNDLKLLCLLCCAVIMMVTAGRGAAGAAGTAGHMLDDYCLLGRKAEWPAGERWAEVMHGTHVPK